MNLEASLYAELTGNATLSALVGSRVYPLVLPQNPSYPGVTYQRVSTNPVQTRTGNGLDFVRMQLDGYAESYADVKTLADAMSGALDGISGTLGGVGGVTVGGVIQVSEFDLYDDTLEIFRVTMDFNISVR